jgi:DNA-binding transcriptional MocR family regulator
MDKSQNKSVFINIDRNSNNPLYRQIIVAVKNLIQEGILEKGQALPSSRKLAEKLGVNRTTVNRAYEELQALGFLSSRPGSYHRVQERRKDLEHTPDRKSLISWEDKVTDSAFRIHETFLQYYPEQSRTNRIIDDVVNISRLDLDPRLFPMKAFKECTNKVLFEDGAESLLYGSHSGYPPLRSLIAQRLRLHGISVTSEEILITNGAQQGLDLCLRIFSRQGTQVALETPTYANILPILRFMNAEVVGVPMTKDGMDLGVLENVLNQKQLSFVYTIPNFQNPTGITTSYEHRERLYSICLQHKIPIVEDGFEEDMKYFGKVALPIKSIDAANIVIYLGTFSKALFPGLRIGWIAADRACVSRLAAVKRFSDLTTSLFLQMILCEFLKRGHYDRQLRRLHRIFRKRMQVALSAIEEFYPSKISWTRPVGGYTIWVRMPKKIGENDLKELMLHHGVIVSPGGYYFPDKKASEYFRLSISCLDEQEIWEGIRRSGEALRSIFGEA